MPVTIDLERWTAMFAIDEHLIVGSLFEVGMLNKLPIEFELLRMAAIDIYYDVFIGGRTYIHELDAD